jgi:aldose 1-epimerase
MAIGYNDSWRRRLKTITLTNNYGMLVEIISYGARIKSIKFPINAKPIEMTLGYESAQEYVNDAFYLGATCGRVCNRIAKGKFEHEGRQYQLSLNDGENCLHGGEDNFSFRYWQVDYKTLSQNSVTLSLVSIDLD